jgi:hypothetical protein
MIHPVCAGLSSIVRVRARFWSSASTTFFVVVVQSPAGPSAKTDDGNATGGPDSQQPGRRGRALHLPDTMRSHRRVSDGRGMKVNALTDINRRLAADRREVLSGVGDA